MHVFRIVVCVLSGVTAVGSAAAFDVPCKVGSGVSISIPGFQDSVFTNRAEGWTKNVCREIGIREQLRFQVVVSNLTTRQVSGRLRVALNEDWEVVGFQGCLTNAPLQVKEFGYVANSKLGMVAAHYPIHARFEPDDKSELVHVVAIFRTTDPAQPSRLKPPAGPLRLGISEAEWDSRAACALEKANMALKKGGCAARGCYLIKDGSSCFGVGVVKGKRDLVDGVLAFTDGERNLVYRGFEVMIDGRDAMTDAQDIPIATVIGVDRGALRVAWSMPGVVRSADGHPRFTRLNLADCSERIRRGYLGLGVVLERPGSFTCSAGGFSHSTRHVGVDYENGLSLVHATDTIPQKPFVSVRERNIFSSLTGNDATFFLLPGRQGAFEAARRFRAVAGYHKSPGHDAITSRVCLDKWFDTDYDKVSRNVRALARYGVTDCIYVKHDWRRWGWDYADPENDPLIRGIGSHAESVRACQEAGMLYVPHDNYVDVYPYSDRYSYKDVAFDVDGVVRKAFYNPGRNILAYRWLPQSPLACAQRNMAIMRKSFAPDGIFLDVYTAHCPDDYMDKDGNYHSRQEMSEWWGRVHRACLVELGHPAGPAISEACQDHLIGVLDAGQSDHYVASHFIRTPGAFVDSERVPWHDIVTHGYYTLFAGGLECRYVPKDLVSKKQDVRLHGYGSDDYLSNTVIGGRNPMALGECREQTVHTYWMLHDVCASLAKEELKSHEFGSTIHRQHTIFSNGTEVWSNRASNDVWNVSGKQLPEYGFLVKAPGGLAAGVILVDGRRIAFSHSPERFYLDVRDEGGAVDFGAIRTARSTCLEYIKGGDEVKITPLRKYRTPYSVCIDLKKLKMSTCSVKSVLAEDVDGAVDWTRVDDILKVIVPANAFRCRVELENERR